jgi:hyaluronan synthase
MSFGKKNKQTIIEDKLVFEKEDRRLLNHVPDKTHERDNSERRGYELEDVSSYEEYIEDQISGIRYVTGFDVELKTFAVGDAKRTMTGKVVDISNTGMLVELNENDYEAIKTVKNLKARFRVVPGSMPEGYEMRVKQKVEVVRLFTSSDGKYKCGVSFTKSLHNYAAANKDRYMLTASALLITFAVACILLMRAESIIYFKFNKMLYLYSLITAVFLLSRYLFGVFYRPKKVDPNYTPGVSILIPCFNEEEWIQRTITSCMNQEYPIDKLEVIVIDDCSTDRSVEKIKEIIDKLKQESFDRYGVEGRLSYHVQKKNAGKREALVVGAEMAKHDLVVFVDSDSFLDPFAIRNIVQPFKDPKMGGVSGRTDVANTYTNALTKMQAVRYYVAFRVMKAAEGLFDSVSCLSGPLSCYRKSIILENKDAWLNQRFLGQKATFGDDRSMTNFILRHHRATYQDTAVCQTIVPNNHKIFLKQQMRWKRSWLRESLIAATFMWRKEPFAAVTFYMGLVVPIAAPLVVAYNLVYVPITQHVFPTAFVLGIFLMSLMMSMAQLLLRKSSTWIYGMLFCLYYELVLLWQMPIAWFTFWKSTWGTRMTPDDVKAAERKLRRRLLKNKKHITPSEFAAVLGIKSEDVISQMNGGRFEKYVEVINGQNMIRAEALKEFYDDVKAKEKKETKSVVMAAESQTAQIETAQVAVAEETVESTKIEETAESTVIAETTAEAEKAPVVTEESVERKAPVVNAVTESTAQSTAVNDLRTENLEKKIDALIAQIEEERNNLQEKIRKRDELIEQKNAQIEMLIKAISDNNENTKRLLDHFCNN